MATSPTEPHPKPTSPRALQAGRSGTHCSWGTIPELSEAGVAGVMGVMGVMGEGYRGVVPGKGAVVRVCEWKSCGVGPEVP